MGSGVAQASERPGTDFLQGWGPSALQITRTYGLVEQRLRLQGTNHPSTEGLTGACVAGTQVDDFEPVKLLVICQDDVAIARPDFILCLLLGLVHLREDFSALCAVKVPTQRPLLNFTLYALSRQR
jgi:hypothetical protein